jgi:subtilisin family serine protease
VEWATSQGVDIMSMSWNVRRMQKNKDDPGNEAEVVELEKAINAAATEKNILMYCAAGDQKGGTSRSMKWVPCDSENTISIGATDIHGTKKLYVVDNERLGYLLPGENVLMETDKDSKDVGNSGATALAAGLAAMVLFFARAHHIHIEHASVRVFMENVFNSVFNATVDNNKVVQVHGVLGEESSKIDKFREKLMAEKW